MKKSDVTAIINIETAYLARFAGSGLLNTLVGFGVIFGIMAIGGSPEIANIAGYAVGFCLGFVVSKKFVFRSKGRFIVESVRYLFAFLFSFLCNFAVLELTLRVFTWNAFLSQVLAAVVYTVLMFLLTRYFVFQVPTKSR